MAPLGKKIRLTVYLEHDKENDVAYLHLTGDAVQKTKSLRATKDLVLDFDSARGHLVGIEYLKASVHLKLPVDRRKAAMAGYIPAALRAEGKEDVRWIIFHLFSSPKTLKQLVEHLRKTGKGQLAGAGLMTSRRWVEKGLLALASGKLVRTMATYSQAMEMLAADYRRRAREEFARRYERKTNKKDSQKR